MKKKKPYNNYILSSLFILMLILPNIILLLNIKTGNAPKLKSEENNYLKEFKDYYTENFGFKATLSKRYINFKASFLNETPLPNDVVFGKNNWFFLGNSYNNTFFDAHGWATIENSQFDNILNNLNNINDYLSSKNIPFYIVIAPNKNNIYKEHLPFKFNKRNTTFDILKSLLNEASNLNFIDLSKSLNDKKSIARLYIKSDSHWNDLGAYYGYEALANEIKKDIDIPIVSLKEYTISEETKNQFDLTKLIDYDFADSKIELKKIDSTKAKHIKPSKGIHRHYVNPEKDKVLILHRDSFANALTQFLNESFGESFHLTSYELNKELIEKAKPDLVIFEIVERNIISLSQ